MKKIFLIVTLILFIFLIFSCNKSLEMETVKSEIAEIAVVECYYHTVAKVHKDKSGILSTDKTIWHEFTAKVKLGIDFSIIGIEFSEADKEKIYITVPPVKIIGDVTIDPASIKSVSSSDGFFKTTITPEENLEAKDEAKNKVLNDIKENTSLRKNAEKRVKDIIAVYISQIMDNKYTIEWKDFDAKTHSIEVSKND